MKTARPLAKTYHVIVVVWGSEYLDLFLNTGLPNQLGEGNMSALPPGSRYRILTRARDVDEVEAHPMVRAVARIMPVDVVAIGALEQVDQSDRWGGRSLSTNGAAADNRFELITECNRQAIGDAVDAGAALIFPSPDHVMSADSLASVVRRHQAGYRAVVCTGMRLEKEGFLRAIDESGRPWGAPPPRELVRMALPHLHAHTRSTFVDAHAFNSYPLGVYWPVGDDGVLARCFFLFPLLLDPVNTHAMPTLTIDAGYVTQACPDFTRVHVVTDSDEFVVFELTEAARAVQCSTGAGAALRRAATLGARCDEFEIEYWRRHPVCIHSENIDERWVAVGARADAFVRAVLRRCRPFGTRTPRLVRFIERSRQLQDRYRRAYRRRLSQVRVKRILRPVRLAKSRASKALRNTTRQFLRRVGAVRR